MCHFFNPDLAISPLVILDETVENDVAVPTGFAEVLAYLLLNGRRDEACAIAILIIIGVAMLADEALTHVWLHPFGHVVIKDVHHTLGILHLLSLAEKGTVGCAYILKTGIDTRVSTSDAPLMDTCLRNKKYSHFRLFL